MTGSVFFWRDSMVMFVRAMLIGGPLAVLFYVHGEHYLGATFFFFVWCISLYIFRPFIPWRKKGINSLAQRGAKSSIDSMHEICLNRDRAQSFDDWVSIAIESMAIDEIEAENPNNELADELRERWGNNGEVMYPKARVEQELLKEESYWTALKKFDDKVAADLGEDLTPL